MTAVTASRRRRVLLIVGIVVAVGIAITITAVLVTWWVMGRDDPSQFEGRVAEIEQRYTGEYPQGEVLLVGSSTFEYWVSAEEDLAPLPTQNVGIRGTKVGDQLAYLDRLVEPFDPRAIVVYTGSNDINGIPLYSKSGADTAALLLDYLGALRDSAPDARLYVVGIVETLARESVRVDVQDANALLAEAAADTGDFSFIDTTSLLLPDGSIDGSLFRDDRLHLTDQGYDAFAAIVRDGLDPEY